MLRKITNLLIVSMFCSVISYGQTFLNGDFEVNTAGVNHINLTNSQYNAMMSNSFAFGNWLGGGPNGGDMDIITTNAYCNYPQHGNWYVALTGDGSDAISLKLSSPLIQGNTYTISYYDRFCNFAGTYTAQPFEIGVSTIDSLFGDSVYTGAIPVTAQWTQNSFTFTAPNSGQYITVKVYGGVPTTSWTQLDNFTFENTSSIQSNNTNTGFDVFPNPAKDVIHIRPSQNQKNIKAIRILDLIGKEYYSTGIYDDIDISQLPSGVYTCEITTDNGISVVKIIKQ